MIKWVGRMLRSLDFWFIYGTALSISFVAGTLVALAFDDLAKFKDGPDYGWWIGLGYLGGGAIMFVALLVATRKIRSIQGARRFMWAIATSVWLGWGLASTFFADWATEKSWTLRVVNVLSSIALGWFAGLASAAATSDQWRRILPRDSDLDEPGKMPVDKIVVVATQAEAEAREHRDRIRELNDAAVAFAAACERKPPKEGSESPGESTPPDSSDGAARHGATNNEK